MVIGIDIGGTTTKIVGLEGGAVTQLLTVKANDPVASASGALGSLVDRTRIPLSRIEKVLVTGVGSAFIRDSLMGIPVERLDEFLAIGLGGLFLSGMEKAIVVSMGTGTAIIRADPSGISHVGGSGVGGGTLLGLSKCILNITDIPTIIEIAREGSLGHIDLLIGDIARTSVGDLPPDATASNFGRISDTASRGDYALGILNLIFQTIGVMAVLAARTYGEECIVLTGKLAQVPQAAGIFGGLAALYGVRFLIPENAEYGTAVGAAISRSQAGKASREGS
jgi:type II pantothenate kinase